MTASNYMRLAQERAAAIAHGRTARFTGTRDATLDPALLGDPAPTGASPAAQVARTFQQPAEAISFYSDLAQILGTEQEYCSSSMKLSQARRVQMGRSGRRADCSPPGYVTRYGRDVPTTAVDHALRVYAHDLQRSEDIVWAGSYAP